MRQISAFGFSQEEFVSLIESSVRNVLKNQQSSQAKTEWLDLDELCQYLPDRPAKSTLYLKLSQGKIPGHKKGKKWFFNKNDIDEWLKNGRLKTVIEIEEESEQHLSKL